MIIMVHFIVGPKGSGKTKWLIDNANDDIRKGNENIVFIDVDDNHIFSLNYAVRLINAMEFNIDSIESFYGFLCGIISSNYDVEKIYIDGIYKILPLTVENLILLNKLLSFLSDKFNTEFFIGSDLNYNEIPNEFKDNCVELTI